MNELKELLGSFAMKVFLWSVDMSLVDYLRENTGQIVEFECAECHKHSTVISDILETGLWLYCEHCRKETTVIELRRKV